ncbi:iron-sulfur cluster co-chaperone protein HscB [Carcharodon carcharias]|uniref:iron-sulfur cluster co-chaperone protein HscB n=1 Tax=Carcharodon carcharias TaxID=13397 RepID=UPI001B7E0F04|nr:iron-sulfur cluster co-chaperone protein HscB [Carcharodon carcharias]
MLRGLLLLRAAPTAARIGAGIPFPPPPGAGIPLPLLPPPPSGAGIPLPPAAGRRCEAWAWAWAGPGLYPPRVPGRRALCTGGAGGCWRCGAAPAEASGGFFCPSCRALQPPDRGRDYFQLLGLPRRFRLEPERLRRRQRRLQRALHPDNFSRSSEAERRFSEEQSALVNEALGTLLKPVSRGLYLLRLELPGEAGVVEEEEEEAGGGFPGGGDPAFLATVLQLNEQLEEARGQEEIRRVAEEVEARLRELAEEVAQAFERGRPREARPLLRQMRFWSSLGERVKERQLPR